MMSTFPIKLQFGIDIQVITPHSEAVFVYNGAMLAAPDPTAPALCMDMGGGSTEVVVGYNGRPSTVCEIGIGSTKLKIGMPQLQGEGVADRTEMRECRRRCRRVLQQSDLAPALQEMVRPALTTRRHRSVRPHAKFCSEPHVIAKTSCSVCQTVQRTELSMPHIVSSKLLRCMQEQLRQPQQRLPVYGTSGTVKAVSSVITQLFPRAATPQCHLTSFTRGELEALLQQLQCTSREERLALPGIKRKRVDAIVPGAILLYELMNYFSIDELAASVTGLREGIVAAHLRPCSPTG